MTNEETAIAAAKTAAEIWLRRRPWIAPQDHDDLKQEAAIAALRAVVRYRGDKGKMLSGWCSNAAMWRMSTVHRSMRSGVRIVNMSDVWKPDSNHDNVSRRLEDTFPDLRPPLRNSDAALDAETVLAEFNPRARSIFRRLAMDWACAKIAESLPRTRRPGVWESVRYHRRRAEKRHPEFVRP